MNLRRRFIRLFQDPPPDLVCELSSAGIAYANLGADQQLGFAPLAPGVLKASPVEQNVLQTEVLAAEIARIAPPASHRRRRRAAVILPDYCARLSVIDFDSFPSEPAEQISLVRFRLKKTVPYDVETAAVQYYVQPRPGPSKKLDVVVGMIPLDIVARYEAPFRAAGLQPGLVTTSALAALGLLNGAATEANAVTLMAKLTANTLTVCALRGPALRLMRTVEMDSVAIEEINAIVYPTLAYIEDELGARPSTIHVCGFEAVQPQLESIWGPDLGLSTAVIDSPWGPPGEFRAGLYGYLRAQEAF